MIKEQDINFEPALEDNFEEFKQLRMHVMRPIVEKQGLPWNEEWENHYHRALFDQPGLRTIVYQSQRIGFIGVSKENDSVSIGRFCIQPGFQNRGIGTCVMLKVLAEPEWSGRKFILDVLKMNDALRLYEKLGFVKVHEDDKLAFYEMPTRSGITTAHNFAASFRPKG